MTSNHSNFMDMMGSSEACPNCGSRNVHQVRYPESGPPDFRSYAIKCRECGERSVFQIGNGAFRDDTEEPTSKFPSDELRDALKIYVRQNGRVCPLPPHWNRFWQSLPNRQQLSGGSWDPPLPLILAAWWTTTVEAKRQRLADHIDYAASQGALQAADDLLRGLRDDEWAYTDDGERLLP